MIPKIKLISIMIDNLLKMDIFYKDILDIIRANETT